MDLLDMLAAQDIDTHHVHLITPSMGLWCGLDLLTALRAGAVDRRRSATTSREVATCTACLDARAAA
ncbi:MAG: hypothetical protein ACO1ON_13020 [Nocardioides sp.]